MAPGGLYVSLSETGYIEQMLSHRKSQAVYLSVRFCRTSRGMCPESKQMEGGLEFRRGVSP